MLVAFATQSDQIAADGAGRNSPFTGALLKEIEQPGIEIATLFRRVAIDVNQATGGRQLPELSISMSGEFYLNTRDTDVQAWAKLRGSSDRRQLSDFIALYPISPLTSDVQERLAALDRAEKRRVEEAARAQAERERAEREQIMKERAQRERLEAPDQAEKDRIEGAGATANLPATHVTSLPPTAPVQSPSRQPDVLSDGALVQLIKKELKRLGCYAGRIDDDWAGGETKSSVTRFVKYAHLSAEPKNPDIDFLNFVRSRPSRVCPLECGTQKIERNGQCVARDKEPAQPSPRRTETKELAVPVSPPAAVARADRAWATGTYQQCMGATTGCYERTMRMHHAPDWARTWCSRQPTC
jgi:hypothetical protein